MTVQHSKSKSSYLVFLKHFESELNKYSLEIRLNEVDFDFKSIVVAVAENRIFSFKSWLYLWSPWYFMHSIFRVSEWNLYFCRYGPPDPNLVRDCDISVKLQMASVRYIHTNRFQMEFVAFLQHFLQLQDVLGRYRAASAGKRVKLG